MSPAQYKHARESAGLSAIQMAKLLGLTRKSIYRREAKGARITEEMAIAQAQVLRQVRTSARSLVNAINAPEMPPTDDVQLHHDALHATAALLAARAATLPSEQPVNPTPDNQPTIP